MSEKCFCFDVAFRRRWRGMSFQNVWYLRLDDGRKEKSMLYLISGRLSCILTGACVLSKKKKKVFHTQQRTVNSQTSGESAALSMPNPNQSKPINLCNCAFGLQPVSKASFYCWTQCLVFRQMPFRSTRPWSVLCSRKERCLTAPNHLFPAMHTVLQKYATKAHPVNFTVQQHDKNTVV